MAQMERIARRLGFTAPFDGALVFGFLASRALAGVEEVDGSTYRRVLSLDHGRGIAELTPRRGSVGCVLRLDDRRDADEAITTCRRLLGLDADPAAITAALGKDPVIGGLVRGRPGLRVPGSVDGFEIALRAIVGQQVSVAGARTTLGRLVAAYGRPLGSPFGALTHEFPEPAALAAVPPEELPMPRVRAEAIGLLARAVAGGELELGPGGDRERTIARLLEIRGVGPWTASYVAMRALGDPDAFLPTDVGVLRRLGALGHGSTPAEATRLAERWRPWRSHAVVQLWTETYTLIGADGKPYESPTPGTLGGHRRQKGYGRLDCPAALRWIAKGHYVKHRVFFADERTAIAAGYRPCAVCMPDRYRVWKQGKLS